MARDPKLWKRNLLTLPGGILTLYALAGLLYVAFYRTGGSCPDDFRFLVGGLCYSAYPFLSALLILGLILVTVGLVVFRGRPADLPGHLHSGTPTHFVLALLVSLVVVPALVWLVLYYVETSQDLRPFMTEAGGYPFQTKFLFLLVVLGAFFALVPFLGLYLSQGRLRRNFLREVEQVAAMEPEAPFPGESGIAPLSDPLAVPPEEFVDESLWPASRGEEPLDAEAAALALPPGTPPAPAPNAPSAGAARGLAANPNPEPKKGPWVPPEPGSRQESPSGALPVTLPPLQPAQAPVVAVHPGCRAMLPSGTECGGTVGPGGRYCIRHACQGRTASGSPCKNPAAEGGNRCAAHVVA